MKVNLRVENWSMEKLWRRIKRTKLSLLTRERYRVSLLLQAKVWCKYHYKRHLMRDIWHRKEPLRALSKMQIFMEKESTSYRIMTPTKDNFLMEKQISKENISLNNLLLLVNSLIIIQKETARFILKMAINMKAEWEKVKCTAKESTCIVTVLFTKVTFTLVRYGENAQFNIPKIEKLKNTRGR